ncbi:hypothetical protein B0H13DRAFT_2366641 [Mycena leptocephala]|nr:hypothetical protein B0H13DRAFT_2366641 [Mycena leptocephala]
MRDGLCDLPCIVPHADTCTGVQVRSPALSIAPIPIFPALPLRIHRACTTRAHLHLVGSRARARACAAQLQFEGGPVDTAQCAGSSSAICTPYRRLPLLHAGQRNLLLRAVCPCAVLRRTWWRHFFVACADLMSFPCTLLPILARRLVRYSLSSPCSHRDA